MVCLSGSRWFETGSFVALLDHRARLGPAPYRGAMTASGAAPARPRVLVAGASGFVGRRLCPALEEAGYDVVAMTRRPASYDGVGRPVAADVHDPSSLPAALEGCQVAYYLVHSLASADFEKLDAAA